jgi:murein DD-endopeptidase MepM/ murein hydrolase activator NlpD
MFKHVVRFVVAGALVLVAADLPHRPPVEAPVIDPFREPPEPWLAGNRGIEYGTEPGDVIRASAAGVVIFAGPVAGSNYVTVRHSPTLVTTAGFVSEVLVDVGDVVEPGDPLAIAGGPIHFTARRNGAYVDPEGLFVVVQHSVRLVANR